MPADVSNRNIQLSRQVEGRDTKTSSGCQTFRCYATIVRTSSARLRCNLIMNLPPWCVTAQQLLINNRPALRKICNWTFLLFEPPSMSVSTSNRCQRQPGCLQICTKTSRSQKVTVEDSDHTDSHRLDITLEDFASRFGPWCSSRSDIV